MWKIITAVTIFLTVGLYLTVAMLDRDLVRQSGYGTLSLQMVSDHSRAEKILNSWDMHMRALAETGLAVDFAFMFLGYGLLFFAVSRLLDSNFLSFFSFLPVVFDSAENIMQIAAILGSQPDMLTASYFITVLKFLCVVLYLLLLTVTAITRFIRKRNEQA